MPQDPPFPRSAAEVDADWLGGALGLPVRSVAVQPLGAGFGQTSDAVRLAYETGDGRRHTVVAKFATQDPARRAASLRTGLYATELRFYRELARGLATRVPACHFLAEDPADGTFALVLEDFPEHRAGDETVGCSPADARLAVVQAAALHSRFWGRAAAGVAVPGVPPLDTLATAWDTMSATFGDHLAPEVAARRDDFLAALPALHAWMVGAGQTVVHGDFRLDNLLFGPPGGPDPLVVVDWQAVRSSRGIHDVAYLVGHSMGTEDRRAHEDALLALYCASLAEHGVTYSLAQAREDYRRVQLYLFWAVLWITGVNVNTHERALRRKRALVQRAGQALLDHDAFDEIPALIP